MTKLEMLDAMVEWMDYVNVHWGQDYGYSFIRCEHPDWFDEETDEPLEEYEHLVYSELDWEPYIREEAEEMWDCGYRLVETGEDCVAGLFIDWCAQYALKQVA